MKARAVSLEAALRIPKIRIQSFHTSFQCSPNSHPTSFITTQFCTEYSQEEHVRKVSILSLPDKRWTHELWIQRKEWTDAYLNWKAYERYNFIAHSCTQCSRSLISPFQQRKSSPLCISAVLTLTIGSVSIMVDCHHSREILPGLEM